MKVHYHGGPMWGNVNIGPKTIWCGEVLYKDSCALISYARPEQLKKISPICKSLVIDNGAFSAWRNAKKHQEIIDWDFHWSGFYLWLTPNLYVIDWFLIPDVIEGTEEENDRLVDRVPSNFLEKAVPVWHSVESIDRFIRLCERFDRVAIGLCGEHSKPTSKKAQARLQEAFEAIYVNRDVDVKIHGLRMLDGRILGKFPFDSADSAYVAVNVPKTRLQMQEEQCKLARTAIYKAKIEKVFPPSKEEWLNQQEEQLHLLLM